MGVLEQVIQMRNQGFSDEDITSHLREQGFSPKAINDAINQANIKSAITDNGFEENNINMPKENIPTPSQENQDEYYIPQDSGSENYPPYPRTYQPQPTYQEIYPQNANAYGNEYYEGGVDADSMVEIAQQVFNEQIKKIHNQIEEINEFKVLHQTKTENINERLKRIETTIDKLQSAILEKIGSYGQGIESIRKELSMMQDSFGKFVNTVADNKENDGKEKMMRKIDSLGEDAGKEYFEKEKIGASKPTEEILIKSKIKKSSKQGKRK